jgi:nitrate/nitrite transporter NarK
MHNPPQDLRKPHVSQIHAWIIWVVGAIFVVYQFSISNTFGVMQKEVGTVLDINAVQLAMVSGSFLFSYALMQIPVGIMLDRFGPRIILGTGAFLLAVSTYLFSIADSFGMAVGARLLMGIASSGAFVGAALLARRWLVPGIFALAMGLADFAEGAGSWAGNIIFPSLLTDGDEQWRGIMQVLSIIGLFITASLIFIVRDRPPGQGVGGGARVPVRRVPQKVWALCKNRQVWLGSVYYAGMSGTLLAFGGIWNIPFQRSYGLTLEDAAGLNSWFWVGMAISAPLAGWISDMVKSRKNVMLVSSVGATLMVSLCLYLPYDSYTEAAVSFAFLGFFLGGGVVVFALISESVKPDNQATAMGLCNATGCVAAFFLSQMPGYFADIKKGDSVQHFQEGMTVFVIFCAVSVIAVMFIRPTKAQYIGGPHPHKPEDIGTTSEDTTPASNN